MDFINKKALVMGVGVSGNGASAALKKAGAIVTMLSSEEVPAQANDSDLIVVSPGIPATHPIFKFAAIKDIPIMGEIGLGAYLNTAPVIGITGTNGKTTTVDMLGNIYQSAGINAQVCGNVGRSFSEVAAFGRYDRAIVELSSFQLLNANPLKVHIACILNLSSDHIDFHGSLFEYRLAKLKITERQTSTDYLIVPHGFSVMGRNSMAQLLHIGDDAYASDGEIYVLGERIMSVDDLSAKGAHNLSNALFAALAAKLDGISSFAIAEGLATVKIRDHRIAFVGEYNGTCFYNDSKGTNISATLAAVNCMKGNSALILGGSDKGYGFSELFEGLSAKVSAIFVSGANADVIINDAKAFGYGQIVKCDSLSDCVSRAALGGFDCVLFSPASASFDKFSNYEERGLSFENEVKRLISEK